MLSVKTAALRAGGGGLIRNQFIDTLRQTIPGLRVLWVAGQNDGLNVVESGPSKRPVTWDSVPAETAQGHGYLQTFNGTSNFGFSPDTDDLTFGNGILDQPFSIVALANATSTAAFRVLAAKWNPTGTNREWDLFVQATTNVLTFQIADETAAKIPILASNSAATTGSPHLFAATYDGTGGATAMNGAILYQDAVVMASTATNQALYIAMANKTQPLEIGAQSTGTIGPFQGSIGMVVVAAGVLSVAQLTAIKSQCNSFFGLAL